MLSLNSVTEHCQTYPMQSARGKVCVLTDKDTCCTDIKPRRPSSDFMEALGRRITGARNERRAILSLEFVATNEQKSPCLLTVSMAEIPGVNGMIASLADACRGAREDACCARQP